MFTKNHMFTLVSMCLRKKSCCLFNVYLYRDICIASTSATYHSIYSLSYNNEIHTKQHKTHTVIQ